MKKQKQLVLARAVFTLIIFVAFGLIIINEKASSILIPKIQKKLDSYITQNYSDLQQTIQTNSIQYKNNIYKMKVSSKDNKNHYFYITYSNKKIQDSYQKDYVEGQNILNHIQKKLQKEIEEITTTKCQINITSTLNNYTSAVQERIIKEDNLLQLKFFTISKELYLESFDTIEIDNQIKEIIKQYKEKSITPKSYTITIINKKDITKAIEISNITEDFINNLSSKQIIDAIIKENNEQLLKANKITYKYLN